MKFVHGCFGLIGSQVFEDICDFGDALIFEGAEGVDFGRSANVFVVTVVVLDALRAEWLDAGAG